MGTMKKQYQPYSGVIVVYPLPRTSIEELEGIDSELQVMVSRLHVVYGRIPHHDTERCHNSWFPDAVSGFHVYSLWRLSAEKFQQVKEFFQLGIRSARRRHGESIAVAAWIPKHQSILEHSQLELRDLIKPAHVDIFLVLASCMLVWSPSCRQARRRNNYTIAVMVNAAEQRWLNLDRDAAPLHKDSQSHVIVNLTAAMMSYRSGRLLAAADADRSLLFLTCACICSDSQAFNQTGYSSRPSLVHRRSSKTMHAAALDTDLSVYCHEAVDASGHSHKKCRCVALRSVDALHIVGQSQA